MTTAVPRAVSLPLALVRLLGTGSMLLFVWFLFAGPLPWVDLGLGEIATLALDAGLCLGFFVQHSGMIRRSFRQRLSPFLPEPYHGALFATASALALIVLTVLWQTSGHPLASPQGLARWLLRAVYILAFAGLVWGIGALGAFDPFGIRAVRHHLRGTQTRPEPIAARGPYQWVRHPLYLFVLLMIWSYPDLTPDRLLFNVLFTAWMIAGTILEERDLVAEYGETYSAYQRSVPMLIPWRLTSAAKEGSATRR
ncbi:MAG: methyltransferase family protein [Planctomycetota bacterium]